MKTRGVITIRSITLDVLDLIKTPAAPNPCAHEDDLMSKPSRSPRMMWDGYLVPPCCHQPGCVSLKQYSERRDQWQGSGTRIDYEDHQGYEMATIFGFDILTSSINCFPEHEGLDGGRLQPSDNRIMAKRHREVIADPLTASTGLRFAELRLRLRA